ncbi:unnamed protein product [Linum tenue]|uniref:Chitin-binding type-1 domain-containing protein n=1 Tax=Linum tenue TaxID=586396 RepID=A0AAV0JJX6_9ROSI|nr:unnamed protein product [Linum tenue]
MEGIIMAAYILIVLGVLQQTARSQTGVERSDHWCGHYSDGSWAFCDPGRCCSVYKACGSTAEYCSNFTCWFSCVAPTPPPFLGHQPPKGPGGLVVQTLLHVVNATHINNHSLNFDDGTGDDQLVNIAPAANASSSSLASSPLSCAASLSRLPLASRHKYPFAALRAPRSQNNVTRCGSCLKVTNVGVRGLPNHVKVRIVHEHNNDEGLELDLDAFNKLDTDGNGITKGYLLVMYEFENC